MNRGLLFSGVVLFAMLVAASTRVTDAGMRGASGAVYTPPASTLPSAEFDSIRTDLKDYIWPTDASMKLTSSFAEYRSTHFHGGIDIGTNGTTGFKVFSVRDGYVYRIRIMPNGYGKMLYVKHRDGYYSTYAHLLKFNEQIRRIARDEQYRLGTYAIDLILDSSNVPVRKGDVIAYTGDSGFGPPHLHFEIRDENLNPVNPMLCENFGVRDDIAPSIRRVMVSPLNPSSSVENSPLSKIMSRFPRRHRQLTIPQTLRVHGMIGFSAEALDRSEGTYSKAGIHRMEFYLDDSLIYAMQLDRVPAEDTKEIDLHYDFPTILHGWGKFQKLYIDAGNTLPFYDRKPVGTGVINTEKLTEGEHEYRIVCKDIHNNSTQLTGKILANHEPEIQIAHLDEEEITMSGKNISSIEKFYVFGKKNSAYDWSQHTYGRGKFERDGNGIELPVDLKRYDVIKIIAESKWGSRSAPLYHFLRKPQGTAREIHLATDISNYYVQFTVSSTGIFTEQPSMIVQEGMLTRSVHLDAIDVYKYTGIFVPSAEFEGKRFVNVDAEINGRRSTSQDAFELYPVMSGRPNGFSILENRLRISYDSASAYKTFYMQASTDAFKNSTVYILEPQDVLLNRGMRVTVDAGKSDPRLGLYFRSNGGWVFQTSTADSGTTLFSTTLSRTLGELALMKDDEEPTLGRLRASAPLGNVSVAFRYHDDLSGVDTDEIRMYVDDTPVIPEIDGEHNRASYKSEEPLPKGKHTLRIVVKDRMKNAAVVTRLFTVR
ncbi:MAG TPA: M23 family metallopeptidase [Bacteroidota bacterium]|nr:M23 family metallopeptidase [Bacteroidota bacterium]